MLRRQLITMLSLLVLAVFAGTLYSQSFEERILGSWDSPDGIMKFNRDHTFSIEDESGMEMFSGGNWQVQESEGDYIMIARWEDAGDTYRMEAQLTFTSDTQLRVTVLKFSVNGDRDQDYEGEEFTMRRLRR